MENQKEKQLKYVQLMADLKKKILSGEILPGEKIPSENIGKIWIPIKPDD